MNCIHNTYLYIDNIIVQSFSAWIFVHGVLGILYFVYDSQKYLTSPFLVIDFNTFDISRPSIDFRFTRHFYYRCKTNIKSWLQCHIPNIPLYFFWDMDVSSLGKYIYLLYHVPCFIFVQTTYLPACLPEQLVPKGGLYRMLCIVSCSQGMRSSCFFFVVHLLYCTYV